MAQGGGRAGEGEGVEKLRFAMVRNLLQFHNFSQFSAIFLPCPSYMPVGAPCCHWCTILFCTTMQNNEAQFCPSLKMIERFLPVPQGHALVHASTQW